MSTSTMFTLLIHSDGGSGPLTVRADTVGKRGMAVMVQDRTGTADVELRISAADTRRCASCEPTRPVGAVTAGRRGE